MSKHTAGPWATSLEYPKLIKSAPDFLGESNVLICAAHGHPDSGFFPSEEEAIANAHLIAAAPDLLEALTLLEAEMVLSGNAHSTGYGWKPAIEKTRAAIAKATGSDQ